MRAEAHGQSGPHWRAILEERWRLRLQEVTKLSMAYHTVAADGDQGKHARRLLRRAVAARRQLADTEDALRRVADGSFGQCEQCAAPIAGALLADTPETRYCAGCAARAPRREPGADPGPRLRPGRAVTA